MPLYYLLDFLTCRTCEENTSYLYVLFQFDSLTTTDFLLSVFLGEKYWIHWCFQADF